MTTPTDIFREAVNAMLCNVHTSLPGIVVDYDGSTNKATIQPALNKNFTSGEMPMPILENVPILFPKTFCSLSIKATMFSWFSLKDR